jgi:hypothetical protein
MMLCCGSQTPSGSASTRRRNRNEKYGVLLVLAVLLWTSSREYTLNSGKSSSMTTAAFWNRTVWMDATAAAKTPHKAARRNIGTKCECTFCFNCDRLHGNFTRRIPSCLARRTSPHPAVMECARYLIVPCLHSGGEIGTNSTKNGLDDVTHLTQSQIMSPW